MCTARQFGIQALLALCAFSVGTSIAQGAYTRGDLGAALSFSDAHGEYAAANSTPVDQRHLTVRYRSDRWLLQALVPLLRVENGAFATVPVAARGGQWTEQGLGDVRLKLAYKVAPASQYSTGVDLALRVKTRTGNLERGLGTGTVDQAVEAAFTRPFGSFTSFGHIGWRRTGNIGNLHYRNPWYSEVGLFTPLTPAIEAGAYFDFRQRIGSLGPVRELTMYSSVGAPAAWRSELYVTRGFSEASARIAVGLSVRRNF